MPFHFAETFFQDPATVRQSTGPVARKPQPPVFRDNLTHLTSQLHWWRTLPTVAGVPEHPAGIQKFIADQCRIGALHLCVAQRRKDGSNKVTRFR